MSTDNECRLQFWKDQVHGLEKLTDLIVVKSTLILSYDKTITNAELNFDYLESITEGKQRVHFVIWHFTSLLRCIDDLNFLLDGVIHDKFRKKEMLKSHVSCHQGSFHREKCYAIPSLKNESKVLNTVSVYGHERECYDMLKLLLMERNILGVHKYKSVTLVIENYENIIANVNTNICELIRKCKNLLTSNKRWCYFSSDDFGFPYIQMKCSGDTTKFNIQHFMNPISRPPMQLYLLNGLIPDPDECPGLVQRLLVDLRVLQDAENEAVALGLAELRVSIDVRVRCPVQGSH